MTLFKSLAIPQRTVSTSSLLTLALLLAPAGLAAQDPDEVLPRSLAALSAEEATKALGIREVGGLGYYSPPKGEGAEAGCAVREGGRKRHYAVVGLHG